MAQITLTCSCGTEYQAHESDIRRGYGKSCGRKCMLEKRSYFLNQQKPLILKMASEGKTRKEIREATGINRCTLDNFYARENIEVRYSEHYKLIRGY